jgi:hypothetical protein
LRALFDGEVSKMKLMLAWLLAAPNYLRRILCKSARQGANVIDAFVRQLD